MKWCDVMFVGEKINVIEDCVVLYMVLWNLDGGFVEVDGEDVMSGVKEVLVKMVGFVEVVWFGMFKG